MSQATKLYTPAVLGLATGLAAYPLDPDLPHHGRARAPLCGSTLELGLALDPAGRIARIGLKAQACAIGQAAATLFAAAAPGRDRAALASALAGLEAWLTAEDAAMPDWPGLEAIAAAKGYPARHGAILLPWKAALAALP